ncbi:hypothetical protein WJX84_010154 [Apatococcus fuscideae]|uniref:Uncharacterized protein n=1 Tax=Apatococcus fuscideae TaxID=2026836 RepID=A0AAW1T892_9CHLO
MALPSSPRARVVKAYLRNKKGSMGELESRGYLDEERGNKDPYLSDAMKNVNTINYEPLSKDQIEAARKRRLRERDQDDIDIEKVELPENHPWAVKQKVTKDEEELQKARLTIRRGAPLQDLTGKRGFPEDPRSRPATPPTEQALR